MKKWAVAALVFLCSCSSFIKDEHVAGLRGYESDRYVMKQNAGREEAPLKKGEVVNIIITTGSDFIKVHAHPVSIDFLKAERVLILFLFDDDFKDKAYDKQYFEERLFQLVDVQRK
ncbi:MAG TPA: hypothetical protein VLM75_08580 [Spirochaetota bacterium]|nr:hypothetical protein [Spirochaetota bacterium]